MANFCSALSGVTTKRRDGMPPLADIVRAGALRWGNNGCCAGTTTGADCVDEAPKECVADDD